MEKPAVSTRSECFRLIRKHSDRQFQLPRKYRIAIPHLNLSTIRHFDRRRSRSGEPAVKANSTTDLTQKTIEFLLTFETSDRIQQVFDFAAARSE